MTKKGISVYPGLDITVKMYKEYILKASKLNYEYIFMSMHLPESNENTSNEFNELLQFSNKLNMKVIVDTSKKFIKNIDFKKVKIYGLRLDFGFTNDEIVDIVNNWNIRVYLNASTITDKWFKTLMSLGLNISNVGAFHNFYPKLYSGLTRENFKEKNEYFKKYGFETLAFSSSQFKTRMPLNIGLPTIEEHRFLDPIIQFQELKLLGSEINFFGDSMASDKELKLVSEINDSEITVPINVNENISQNELSILTVSHKIRIDDSAFLIRSETSRERFKELKVVPNNTVKMINEYDVTIDNVNYPRYNNELQIWTKSYNYEITNSNLIGNVINSKNLLKLRTNQNIKFLIKT